MGLRKVQKGEGNQITASEIVCAHTSYTLTCTNGGCAQKLPPETGRQITAAAESNTAYNKVRK